MPDPRFARLKFDPRFRHPRRKQSRLVVDDRFKGIFEEATEKKKSRTGQVDKYGRPLLDSHEKDNLKRFYHLENEEEVLKPHIDYARGEVLLESSDEENSVASSTDDESDENRKDPTRPITVDSDAEIDLDETNFEDLDRQAAASQPEAEDQPVTHTHRLAVVNLDWQHVRAIHLFKICSSLLSPAAPILSEPSPGPQDEKSTQKKIGSVTRGRVLYVRVYPSEFGKERIAREELEGPPPYIFKKRIQDETTLTSLYEVGGEEEYDEDALRTYQLERMRYYYAIITCDTVEAATRIFTELEGTELERSANVFDLSYVPDDMTFEEDFRDEATHDPDDSFKGIEFVTDALRHSKVKLTWDEDDHERSQITRRKLTRQDIENADFRAYLASSDSEFSDGGDTNAEGAKPSRDHLRSMLLGKKPNDLPEGWGHEDFDKGDVDMEITFTPGLSEEKGDETTAEAYRRRMKDKKRRKEEKKVTKDVTSGPQDDFFEIKNIGHNDKMREREVARLESTSQELALLLTPDKPEAGVKHFSFKSILKAEKKQQKGKKKVIEDDNEIQTDFTIDVKDERFVALHNDPQFAIDPTNPHFKKTKSMTALLEERSRRQKKLYQVHEASRTIVKDAERGEHNLNSLVDSIKRKSGPSASTGISKRRKV